MRAHSAPLAGQAPDLHRRSLAALLTIPGVMLLAAGCGGPQPVSTSADIARDPLASLDPAIWNARSAEELRGLSIQGAAGDLGSWADLGADDSFVDSTRDLLTTFVSAAYLAPEDLRGLDDEAAHDHISKNSPESWQDGLRTAWDDGNRLFYAIALAEPFRTVGRPAIAADWYRTEHEEGPALALGATVAWTALHTESRAVGVFAYRLGIVAKLEEDGSAGAAELRMTIHGLDGCGITENEGLLVPALADDEQHRDVQKATQEEVLASPHISLEELLADESALFVENDRTYLTCD
ncbi:hypothetical protein GCM10023160_27890 [Brachybacterium paraconglomeratum]|uniref:hypothetical protein n=1 Tax=Brachybacterium paraconglomeratum TaxID=173362 RepID=UPI0031ED9882